MASIPTITAPNRPQSPSRLADAARIAAFGLAIVLVEAALARGVSAPEVARYVYLFIGVFAAALVFRFPMATALVFFALTDFIFPSGYFSHSVGSLTVKPHEIALVCLLALSVVRPKRDTWGGVPGAALAVFLGLVGFSAALAVSSGDAALTEAFNWARPLFLLTVFYVVIRLFPEPEERRFLLTGAAVLAALTGVVALMIALGAGFGSALEGSDTNAIRSEGLGAIQRVRLAGLSIGYALFWYVVVQAATRRGWPRLGWFLVVAGIAIDIAVSFNRNMWLGLAIGAILMAILGGALIRHRMAVGVAVAIGGLAVLMVFGTSSTGDQVVQPIIKRGATILSPSKTAHESSLEDRNRETSTAWATARDHLLLGVGAGTPYGVYIQEPISTGSFIIGVTPVPQLYLHNQYLYLILIAGIPGLIAFVVFLGSALLQAVRRAPRDPAITGLGVGIAMIMVSSVVAIYFTVDDMTAALGLLVGVIVADFEGRAARSEPAGLTA